jgi:hypothetical protein
MRYDSRSALTPLQRFVARRIVASTQRLVGEVMARQWQRIPELMAERRALLSQLPLLRDHECEASCTEALRAAVTESDRLLAGIMLDKTGRPRG